MKRKLLLISAFIFAISAFAQQQIIISGQSSIFTSTALKVDIDVKKEVIVSGPYARYAQQYLGTVVPLSDRTEYSIVSANISAVDVVDNYKGSNFSPTVDFVDKYSLGTLSVNKNSSSEKSLQAMASEAAQAIFSIRRKKMELIIGETQEVYGAGIEAAIREMNKLEQEYVDLFMGTKYVSYSQHTFGVVPTSDNKSYVLTRFSDGKGVLDILSSDGSHVVLTLTPENGINVRTNVDKRASYSLNSAVVVPEWVSATLMYDKKTITTSIIQMTQFGKIVDGPSK